MLTEGKTLGSMCSKKPSTNKRPIAPPSAPKPKLKKACFKCGTFNPKMGAKRYKCAVPGRCPGRDWSKARKEQALRRGRP